MNYLGIYISKQNAAVAFIDDDTAKPKLLGAFQVNADKQNESGFNDLSQLIAKQCAQKFPAYKSAKVALALDCAMFMQHNVHSEFKDARQIAQTIRFDAEDSLMTDINQVAIAFKVNSTDETGSQLTVFTIEKNMLSDIIQALQANKIDPVTIEPDVNALARLASQNLPEKNKNSLIAAISQNSGYFIVTDENNMENSVLRTFLVNTSRSRSDILVERVPMTTALIGSAKPVKKLLVLDADDSLNCETLSQKIDIDAEKLILTDLIEVTGTELENCPDKVNLAVAAGAAMANRHKSLTADFRNDFMPYMGKKNRIQNTARLVAICLTIIFVALGVYFQMPLTGKNKQIAQLRGKFTDDYLAIFPGSKQLPASPARVISSLKRELKKVSQGEGHGTAGQASVPQKLMIVLTAFNKTAKASDLDIEKITVAEKNITIKGTTSSKTRTEQLEKTLTAAGFQVSLRNSVDKGRDSFDMTLKIK